MPPVLAPAKALVTGANGFVGAWVTHTLLEQGYSVIGTIRSASKAGYLQRLFAPYGDRFSVAIVSDITKPGAFDEIVKDIQIVEHVASPCRTTFETPSELIDPAVRGTMGVLQSVLKYGTSVRRVVITSSTAALYRPAHEHTVVDESIWHQPDLHEIQTNWAAYPPILVYCAGKTLAEQAAWKFVEENKPAWDLVTFTPPWVFGPPIHEVTSLSTLNSSIQYLYGALVTGEKDAKALASEGGHWVDVRDLARAHVVAAQREEAGGNRFIVSQGPYFLQDVVDAVADNGDAPAVKGEYGATKGKNHLVNYDTSKAKRLLGMEYIGMHEMCKDLMMYFKEYKTEP